MVSRDLGDAAMRRPSLLRLAFSHASKIGNCSSFAHCAYLDSSRVCDHRPSGPCGGRHPFAHHGVGASPWPGRALVQLSMPGARLRVCLRVDTSQYPHQLNPYSMPIPPYMRFRQHLDGLPLPLCGHRDLHVCKYESSLLPLNFLPTQLSSAGS